MKEMVLSAPGFTVLTVAETVAVDGGGDVVLEALGGTAAVIIGIR